MPDRKSSGYRTVYPVILPVFAILLLPIILISIRPSMSPYIIAVPAENPSLSAPVSHVFSRAPYFIIYDTQSGKAKYLVNIFANGAHEVGLHVAHVLINERVGAVIAKNVGPEPYCHLAQRGIKVYEGLAIDVRDAIAKYTDNLLVEKKGPTGFAKTFPVPQ